MGRLSAAQSDQTAAILERGTATVGPVEVDYVRRYHYAESTVTLISTAGRFVTLSISEAARLAGVLLHVTREIR